MKNTSNFLRKYLLKYGNKRKSIAAYVKSLCTLQRKEESPKESCPRHERGSHSRSFKGPSNAYPHYPLGKCKLKQNKFSLFKLINFGEKSVKEQSVLVY